MCGKNEEIEWQMQKFKWSDIKIHSYVLKRYYHWMYEGIPLKQRRYIHILDYNIVVALL